MSNRVRIKIVIRYDYHLNDDDDQFRSAVFVS